MLRIEFDWWEVFPKGSPIPVLGSCLRRHACGEEVCEITVLETIKLTWRLLIMIKDSPFRSLPQRNDDDDDGTVSQGGC